MSISLRNQRVRIFALQEQGAGGWTKDVYVATEDAWARVEPPTGGDLVRFEGGDHTVSAVVTLDMTAQVPKNGMIRVLPGGDSQSDYRILSTLLRRMVNEKLVYTESMTQDEKPHEVDDSTVAVGGFTVEPYGPQYVHVGDDVQFTCTVVDTSGYAITRTVVYSSTTGNVTIDADTGALHAVSVGFALINILIGGSMGTSVAFHVQP